MSKIHVRSVSYMQKFTFVLKYKFGQQNKVANALSKRATLQVALINEFTSIKYLKELYVKR